MANEKDFGFDDLGASDVERSLEHARAHEREARRFDLLSARKDARAEVERHAHVLGALCNVPIEDWSPELREVLNASRHACANLAPLAVKEIEEAVEDILRRAGRLGSP